MPSLFVLVHSPLVGPVTWEPVAAELRVRGFSVVVPELRDRDADPTPYWRQHAEPAARALEDLGEDSRPWLVGHSGAGALLPAIRQCWGHAAGGYCFVDAGIPRDSESRLGAAEASGFARQLRPLLDAGGRFPDWTDEALRPLIADGNLRRRVLAELRPQPARFWDEPIPVFGIGVGRIAEYGVFGVIPCGCCITGGCAASSIRALVHRIRENSAHIDRNLVQFQRCAHSFQKTCPLLCVFGGWPDAPCAYLQFSAAYDESAAQARAAGWPYQQLSAGHFHMLVEPVAVVDALIALVRLAPPAANTGEG